MATVGTIKSKILRKLQDTDQNNYGDGELFDFFNEVLDDISEELAKLRARIGRASTTISISSGTNSGSLPTGFLSAEHVLINGEDTQLDPVSDAQIVDYEDDTSTGEPARYWFEGGTIYVNPIADAAYTLKLVYYPKKSITQDSDTLPWEGLFDTAIYWGVLAACYFRSEMFPMFQVAESKLETFKANAISRILKTDNYQVGFDQSWDNLGVRQEPRVDGQYTT